jgi:hypothetical protein
LYSDVSAVVNGIRTTNSSRALLSQRSVESTVRMSRNCRRWIIHIPLKSTKLTPNDIRFGHRAPSAAQLAVGVDVAEGGGREVEDEERRGDREDGVGVGLGARDARVVGVLAPDGCPYARLTGQISVPAPGGGIGGCGS